MHAFNGLRVFSTCRFHKHVPVLVIVLVPQHCQTRALSGHGTAVWPVAEPEICTPSGPFPISPINPVSTNWPVYHQRGTCKTRQWAGIRGGTPNSTAVLGAEFLLPFRAAPFGLVPLVTTTPVAQTCGVSGLASARCV